MSLRAIDIAWVEAVITQPERNLIRAAANAGSREFFESAK
jgi:hypothetical protein